MLNGLRLLRRNRSGAGLEGEGEGESDGDVSECKGRDCVVLYCM